MDEHYNLEGDIQSVPYVCATFGGFLLATARKPGAKRIAFGFA
jgi:hypothetical protein